MDEILFQSVKKDGDLYAFKILFTKYYKRLCKYCFSLSKSKTVSEELAADVLQIIWEKRAEIEITSTFSPYVYRLARNYTFNYLRSKKRDPSFESISEILWDEPQFHEDPLAQIIEKENVSVNIEYVNRLDGMIDRVPKQRKKIFLFYKEGMKHKDIASELNLSVKTVRNNIELASRQMKNLAKTIAEPYTIAGVFFIIVQKLS